MKLKYKNSWAVCLGVLFLIVLNISCSEDKAKVIKQDAKILADMQCKLKELQSELYSDSSKQDILSDSLVNLQRSIADFQMEVFTAYQTLADKESFSEAYRNSFSNCPSK